MVKNMVFFLVKFFKKENDAKDFVRGRVRAGTLSSFKKREERVDLRMDKNEGTLAWLQPGKVQIVVNDMDMSGDLAGPAQIQPRWLDHINVFCVHAAHSGDLDLASLSNIEPLRQELMVPDKCLALGKYAVVVKDVREFINRMKSSAQAKGYGITSRLVNYYNPATFHGWFRNGSVESVFWKQDKYRDQREYRFAINRDLSSEHPLYMEIGDIGDITLQFKSTELNGKKFLGGQFDFAREDK